MNINDAMNVMLQTHLSALRHGARANGVQLVSGPGIGKSEGSFQYAAALAKATGQQVGFLPFMLATISSVDVKGFMIPTKNATGGLDTVFSTPPWFPTPANCWLINQDGTFHKPGGWVPPSPGWVPEIGVLLLDEFSQAEDEVKKPAAELIYKGNVGDKELPVGWRVVAAGNRMGDRSGVLRELMFIVNRRLQLNVDASLPSWLEWVLKQSPQQRPHYLTRSFAQKNPDIVFKDAVPAGTDPFCTPRTLVLMDRDLRALRTQAEEDADRMPVTPVAREVAAGWIGGASAAQYFTHVKYADELPDIDDIIADPAKAKLPVNTDAQMVCAYMLSGNITEKNAPSLAAYLFRLRLEMQHLAVRNMSMQTDTARFVFETKEFNSWLVKNKDVLVAARA